MAKNTRVGLSLPPSINDVLTRMSLISGQPKTAIITEILNDSVPLMEQVVKALEETKKGQHEVALKTMENFLADTSNSLNQAHIEFGGVKAKHGKQ